MATAQVWALGGDLGGVGLGGCVGAVLGGGGDACRQSQLAGAGTWQRAGDERRKKTGRIGMFETLLKLRGLFCKFANELGMRQEFRD